MSCNYHANQFEDAFKPTRLKNWEVPKYSYSSRPSQTSEQKQKSTTVICNSDGHFLPNVTRPKNSPWGNYKSTWELPHRITRKDAEKLCNELVITKPIKCIKKVENFEEKKQINDETASQKSEKFSKEKTDEKLDFTYKPGALTDINQQYKSEESNGKNSSEPSLNDLYLEKHQCNDTIALLNQEAKKKREKIPHVLGDDVEAIDLEKMKSSRKIPDKPNEQIPCPFIPAYSNFQLAKRMHQENLEHQPLPDCIMDQAFRKLQAQRHSKPGLALDVVPQTSGIGVKTFNAGPTHCTKLKVYRPKTCGILPKSINDTNIHRPMSSVPIKDQMGSMDLAICWDYRPRNPMDEPKPPKHIDGSNGSTAPAVFTLVKTPRTPDKTDTGRSGGVFTNTFGEPGFFDKDILRKQAAFAQRSKSDLKCSCGTSPINIMNNSKDDTRPKSTASSEKNESLKKSAERCKSSPNLSQLAVSSNHSYKKEIESHNQNPKKWCKQNRVHTCSKYNGASKNIENNLQMTVEKNCNKHNKFMAKSQFYPQISSLKEKERNRMNDGDARVSSDSGCSTMSSNTTCSTTKILYIPKPRHPYPKKNYNIDTLVPPFTCYKGGAGQGGYPEHWRLASVYQHAYKPIEQRKAPLLQTVYK